MDQEGDLLRRAQDLYDRGRQHEWQAQALYQSGRRGDERAAELREAVASYAHALELLEQAGDRRSQAQVRYAKALVHGTLRQFDEALEELRGALATAGEVDDRQGQLAILGSLAGQLQEMGRLKEALGLGQEALEVARRSGLAEAEASALDRLGALYGELGRPQEALDCFGRAVSIHRERGQRRSEAVSLGNIGVMYRHLGQADRAVEHLERSLALIREAGDAGDQAAVYLNLVPLYEDLGRREQALELAEEALAYWSVFGPLHQEARALDVVGGLYHALGDDQRATELVQRAVEIHRQAGARASEANALHHLAAIHLGADRVDLALGVLGDALTIRREVGDPGAIRESLHALARASRRLGDRGGAGGYFEEAVGVVEEMRGAIAVEDLRTGYMASVSDLYAEYVSHLASEGDAERALEIAEKGRARAFVELLARAGAEIREGADPELMEAERRLLGELSAVRRHAVAARFGPEPERDPDAAGRLGARAQDLERALESTQAQIRQRSPRVAAVTQPEVWGLQQIRHQLASEQTALLEYVLDEDQGQLFVITEDRFAVFPLPPSAHIEARVRALREAILDPAGGMYPFGHDLYLDLIDRETTVEGEAVRARDLIRGRPLLICPDGILHYLPFEALLTEAPEGPPDFPSLAYLVREHAVAYAPSGTVAGHLKQAKGGEDWTLDFLAFADPDLPAAGGTRSAVLDAARSHTGAGLEALPGTRAEVTHIAGLLEPDPHLDLVEGGSDHRHDGIRVALRLRGEASKAAVVDAFDPRAEPRPMRFVHFSTHGLLDEDRPQFSGLVLSPGAADDPYWQTFEIFNARIPADLCVLSACETGLGKVVGGEGVIGLARAFFYAGARSLVVSLWKVPDEPTASFMGLLYEHLLADDHHGKSEAIRRAKLEQIHAAGPTAHPYFWGAFVLLGPGK